MKLLPLFLAASLSCAGAFAMADSMAAMVDPAMAAAMGTTIHLLDGRVEKTT